ncbi:Zranb3 [Symbiodinium necroappetens]|uniref:Zranb3 protein n=1 Tax=Symbiodinium necroappetens TaxID=1628268 RepID=A0A812REJ9_9DINO|nr:Zranb3 [Symbiodinium necroappetens]
MKSLGSDWTFARRNRTFDWVFIVDDDVYVVVDNLRRVLARLHPRWQLQTAALGYGITGCVTKGRPCGFCGGGGYALSAKAVQVLLGDDTEKFMHRYMNDCQRTRYCDVTTECLAEQNGTKVFKMHGLHPWRVGNPKWNLTALEGFFHTPSGTLKECPISFHYVQESQTMRAAHELAKRWEHGERDDGGYFGAGDDEDEDGDVADDDGDDQVAESYRQGNHLNLEFVAQDIFRIRRETFSAMSISPLHAASTDGSEAVRYERFGEPETTRRLWPATAAVDWLPPLRQQLSQRKQGGDRLCSLKWCSDGLALSLLSGDRLLTLTTVGRDATFQNLKQRLLRELNAEDRDVNFLRGAAAVGLDEQIGDLNGVVLQQQEVQRSEDGFSLLPYQRSAVEYALQRSGRVLLGHEMGLGKTVIALAVCANYRKDWPVLVVAPTVLLDQWSDEIQRWLPDIPAEGVQVVRKAMHMKNRQKVPVEIKPTAKFVLVSYGLVVGQVQRKGVAKGVRGQSNGHLRVAANGQPYRTVIIDEAHALKDFGTQRTKTLIPILHRATRAILMTGTPLANASAGDILPLMAAVIGHRIRLPPVDKWCAHFCAENRQFNTGFRTINRWIGVSKEHEEALSELLHFFMVRRTKEEVLAELPPKRRLKVRLELTPSEMGPVTKQQQAIAAFEKAAKENSEGEEIDSLPSHEIMKVFKLLAEAKQGAVCDWLHTSFFDEQAGVKTKVLIFAHHKCVHEKLAEFFKKQLGEGSCGDSWVHLTGETSPSERSKQLNMFKSADRCRFAVLALTACGTGLNLDIADTCIFAELCWTPSALNQAESRIHRMGQQARRVLVYYLVAGVRGSPDEIMFNALATKAETVSRVVDHELENPSALRDSQLLTPKRKRRSSHLDEVGETPELKPKRPARRQPEMSAAGKQLRLCPIVRAHFAELLGPFCASISVSCAASAKLVTRILPASANLRTCRTSNRSPPTACFLNTEP